LLTLKGGVADNLLRRVGLSIESVESYLSSKPSLTEEGTIVDRVPLGASAELAFVRAENEAGSRQHTFLGTEYLLLAILAEESGEATDLLASFHIDRENLKRAIQEEIQ
jgi:ATP-dependent Clp protease ATP-binding subunit ClpA